MILIFIILKITITKNLFIELWNDFITLIYNTLKYKYIILGEFRMNRNVSEFKTVSENVEIPLVDVEQLSNIFVGQQREVELCQFLVVFIGMI